MRAYETFLLKKETVKSQYDPYYLKWFSDCYAFLNEPLSNRLRVEQRKQFLLNMAKRHEDWQVKQAEASLRLYDYFLSKTEAPKPGELSSHEESWVLVEEKMREALRLRHRSLSTEKTYLTWVRGFKAFVGGKDPDGLRGETFRTS